MPPSGARWKGWLRLALAVGWRWLACLLSFRSDFGLDFSGAWVGSKLGFWLDFVFWLSLTRLLVRICFDFGWIRFDLGLHFALSLAFTMFFIHF